ncbi:hypothetical protein QE250_17025, partial [Chromatiaceae bacterium AAb-1]|nr:hypothetical protein [Chromatiaceae bacterium AAb-1]
LDVIYLNFIINDISGRVISSHFVVNKNISVGVDHISIVLDDRDISLYGLKREEALILSQLCIEPEVIVKHYDKLDSWYSEYCGEIGTEKAFCGDR